MPVMFGTQVITPCGKRWKPIGLSGDSPTNGAFSSINYGSTPTLADHMVREEGVARPERLPSPLAPGPSTGPLACCASSALSWPSATASARTPDRAIEAKVATDETISKTTRFESGSYYDAVDRVFDDSGS